MTEMTIHETTAAFINHLRENGKKERTPYTYRKDLDLIEGSGPKYNIAYSDLFVIYAMTGRISTLQTGSSGWKRTQTQRRETNG